MKRLILFICILLVVPCGLAEYEDILNGPGELVDGALLHVQKPFLAYTGSEFEIIVIPVVEEDAIEFNLDLFKEGELLEKTLSIEEINGEDTLVVIWTDTIEADTEYELTYERIGGESSDQQFSIQAQEKVVVDRTLSEEIYFPTQLTDNQREHIIDLLNTADYDYSLDQFSEEEARAKDMVKFEKKAFLETLVYNDGSNTTRSVIVIDITSEESLQDINIIETIPKDFAFHVDELYFEDQPIILEDDPIIMWHLEDVEQQRIEYSVDGEATLTGNTILLAGVIKEEDVVKEPSSSSRIWLPLLLIPLVALVLIFFSRFVQKPKKKRR